jgi:hypothetical protein
MHQKSRVVIISGDIRAEKLSKVRKRFPNHDFEWIATRESKAKCQQIQAVISREDTTHVIALVGLIRHQHFHDIKEICKHYDKGRLVLRRSLCVKRIDAFLNSDGSIPLVRPECGGVA